MDVSLIDRPTDTFQAAIVPEVLAQLYASTGTDVPLTGIEELASGLFNNTYRLRRRDAENWILRVGPAPHVDVFYNERQLLRREVTVAPQFEALGPLFPRNLYVDCTRELIDRDFVVQNELPGEIWDTFDKELTAQERASLWRQLGEITAGVHAIEGVRFGFPEPARGFTRWSEFVFDLVAGMTADLRRHDRDTALAGQFLEVTRGHADVLDQITRPRLAHGDIWPKNVLVDRSTMKITGLIDAERAFWGDPQAEWVYSMLEVPADYWEGYGKRYDTPGDQVRHQIYRGVYTVQLLLESIRFKFDDAKYRDILQEQIAALGRSFESS